MSLEPISNDIILKAEKMIKQGATYNQIKEICHISNGTIAKIKQGKITSDRVVKPIYSDRVDELLKESKKLKEISQKNIDKYNNLLNKLEKLRLENKKLKEEIKILKADKSNR